MTPEEYLEIDRKAEFKSEFLPGEMRAVAGTGRVHSLVLSNLAREMGNMIRAIPCEGYCRDMRVRVDADPFPSPDYLVVCGEPRFLDEHQDILLNPTLIVEVMSPATVAYDLGQKFHLYGALDSLREYLVICSRRVHATRYLRQTANQWLVTSAGKLEESIQLESTGARLRLADLYEKVEFVFVPPHMRPLQY